jgi:peptide/nickel transport system substrate-binding protein
MYLEQKTLPDIDERAEVVHEMQRMVYEQAPYVVLWYDRDLQAYNNEWTGFQPQPAPDGDLLAGYGKESFLSLDKASAEGGDQPESGGLSAGVWIAGAAALVVIGAIAALARRRSTDEDRA